MKPLRADQAKLVKVPVVWCTCPRWCQGSGENAATDFSRQLIEGSGGVVLDLSPPSEMFDAFQKELGGRLISVKALSNCLR